MIPSDEDSKDGRGGYRLYTVIRKDFKPRSST
jgi:hypothetical protein